MAGREIGSKRGRYSGIRDRRCKDQ